MKKNWTLIAGWCLCVVLLSTAPATARSSPGYYAPPAPFQGTFAPIIHIRRPVYRWSWRPIRGVYVVRPGWVSTPYVVLPQNTPQPSPTPTE